ncbi:MAG: YraN family protein [Lutibacter sp.]
MATHNDFGKKGEQIAVDFLIKKDYKILATNWRYQKAEIDIIALKDETLIVVEVKTRNSNYFGNPQDFVSKKKIRLLTLAINEFVLQQNLDYEIRFDIIGILHRKNQYKIEHLKNAFYYFND